MDEFTRTHLEAWIDRAIALPGEDDERRESALLAILALEESDPEEFDGYLDLGWRRVLDIAEAN